jgi:hypothetical protein
VKNHNHFKIISKNFSLQNSKNSFVYKTVEHVNKNILKKFPIVSHYLIKIIEILIIFLILKKTKEIARDIDCNNCKLRRNYDLFLKEKIASLTFDQHELSYMKDERKVINDYSVRFYFDCQHPECESKFFILINLINNKASLFSNIDNVLMPPHHFHHQENYNVNINEDHDYCRMVYEKKKIKQDNRKLRGWSDYYKV